MLPKYKLVRVVSIHHEALKEQVNNTWCRYIISKKWMEYDHSLVCVHTPPTVAAGLHYIPILPLLTFPFTQTNIEHVSYDSMVI